MRSLKRRIGHKNPNTQLSALNVGEYGQSDPAAANIVPAAYRYVCEEWRIPFLGGDRLPRVYGQLGIASEGVRRCRGK